MRKETINIALGSQNPLVWEYNMINRLKSMDNKWARVVEFLFDRVKEGYIIDFSIECIDSFSEDGRIFVVRPRKRLLEEDPPIDQNVVFGEGVDAHGSQ
jgi:hypothetical protein